MKITTTWTIVSKVKEAVEQVNKAEQKAMRDVVVAIHGDAIKNAKSVGAWKTGHNARSIASEVSGMGGTVKQGEDALPERIVDDSKMEGAVYSTSGYGGWLEVGHGAKPNPRPYFKPALDKNFKNLPKNMKAHLGRGKNAM